MRESKKLPHFVGHCSGPRASGSATTATGVIVDAPFGHETTSMPMLFFINVAQSMYEVLRRPRNLSRESREVTSATGPELTTIGADAALELAASVLDGAANDVKTDIRARRGTSARPHAR